MEGRLDQPPLAQVMFAFTGQQPFAEQDFRPLQDAAFAEVCLLVDQNLFDKVGMIDEVEILVSEPEVTEVRVLFRHPGQESERVPAESRQVADDQRILRSMWPGDWRWHAGSGFCRGERE